MDDPRYRSFVVRLWRTPEGEVWRGEVESIQNGAISTIASLEELVGVIRRSLVGNNEQSTVPDGDKQGGSAMPVEASKAVVLQLIADMSTNLDALDTHPGMAPSKPFFQQMFAAFPDNRAPEIKELLGEGDWVAARMISRGTHRGEFMGMPATGRFAEWEVTCSWRVVDGKIVESHAQADNISLMQQLGVLPAPVGA